MNTPSRPIRTDVPMLEQYGPEHDACAIYMAVRKQGESTYGTLKRALASLAHMGHRTGFVNGEGDGVGVQTDIPRELWAHKLSMAGIRSSLATHAGFWVGHLFIPHDADYSNLRDSLHQHFTQAGLEILVDQKGRIRAEVLGRSARQKPPQFYQIAGYGDPATIDRQLLQVQTAVEAEHPEIHFASLSSHTVVYKVRGQVETLTRYYPDLQDRSFNTAMALGHARYSTNTVSNFERAQPFAVLGHNGEINTISKFRTEAKQIGAVLPPSSSDSQDLDRAMHTLCAEYGLDLIESMEMIFPPVAHEVNLLAPAFRTVYQRMRQAYGPYAQGPAAIVARYADTAVFSVDALGLRPLWFVETEKEYIFSSERGTLPLETMVDDPRPLAPGEKMALHVRRGIGIDVYTHTQIREHVMNQTFQREAPQLAQRYWGGWEHGGGGHQHIAPIQMVAMTPEQIPVAPSAGIDARSMPTVEVAPAPWDNPARTRPLDRVMQAAFGWNREHIRDIEAVAKSGKDPVGSMGHDGPLAVISQNRVNLADAFKETVAVVTTPAIDRGREGEAFTTQSLVGARPLVGAPPAPEDLLVLLGMPVLTGGHPDLGGVEVSREVAESVGTLTIEDLLTAFTGRVGPLVLGIYPGEDAHGALKRLQAAAVEAAHSGNQCLVLDDFETVTDGLGWLDPHLAVAAVDNALREADAAINLRRRAGIVVRSGSVRNLHDVALLYGFGADAINPYLVFDAALGIHPNRSETPAEDLVETQTLLLKALHAGLEKVISTMGCHELRGYGRVFSSIGLAPSMADILSTPNYFGHEDVGLNWAWLNSEAETRGAELRGAARSPGLAKVDRFFPRFWRKVEKVAQNEGPYEDVLDTFNDLIEKQPVALRHLVDFKSIESDISPEDVDISIDGYDMPVLISAMSFGSQGELSYKAYANAAAALNIICINGEGGELPDMMGRNPRNRGQQVASGRFGVNAEFLNSAAVIEIKIGQGAKPGEGGMLPGFKVTAQVAQARHTTPGVPLLSPSNNHDLYSIEDLAQLIEELKTVNPEARVSVKCPVVPGIGVIAVGVAKAGADIITVTGYDGATGAARLHALQYVGLPAEVGVIQAHRALAESGLRHKVELWADGGMKTGADAVKMILLGANRVGFASMAMVSIGCTICRMCNKGDCHVGITTHIKSVEEAKERGLKRFVPRVYDESVIGIVRVFTEIANEMRQITAALGATHLQDLVGRADLLEQVRMLDKVNLNSAFVRVPFAARGETEPGVGLLLTRPRNNLTRFMSELIEKAALEYDEREVTYQDEVQAYDRALGAHVAGALMRDTGLSEAVDSIHLRFGPSSIAGNGFAAWSTHHLDIIIEGGAQDGVGKSSRGGRVAIMKGLNHDGKRVDGSVGKSFAYGAQGGLFVVQGNADSRACIRLSGADVIFGGEITQPVMDQAGSLGTNSNLKGFACEYMTSGRVVIMGDPGPYAFAGMTGGVVYQLLTPQMGFDVAALKRRLAEGAHVLIEQIDSDDIAALQELLGHYIEALELTGQWDIAARTRNLSIDEVLVNRFVRVVPDLSFYH